MSTDTTLIVLGLVLAFIGLVMLIIGIIVYEQNKVTTTNPTGTQPWYTWLLIIGGIILGIIGIAMLIWGMMKRSEVPVVIAPVTQTLLTQPAPVPVSVPSATVISHRPPVCFQPTPGVTHIVGQQVTAAM